MSIAFRSAATVSALVISATTPALAQPSAAFPPEPPPASAEARAALPTQTSSPYPQSRPVYAPQRPLYYPAPAPSLHLVGFRSDVPHTRFAIEFDQNRRVLGWCTNWCWVHLWPGRYRVHVGASKNVLGGSRPFTVKGPALVTVSPRSHRSRFWLGVGIGSPVLAIGGLLLLAEGAGNHRATEQNPQVGVIFASMLMFLAGMALTPISWIEWERSSMPGLTVEPMAR